MPLEETKLSWLTDGCYLKDKSSYYRTGYAIVSLTENTEANTMPEATAQQPDLFALTRACFLVKDKTSNIYIY